MTIALSQTQSLKEMLALEEKRAALQGQLDAINQRLSALKDSIIAKARSLTRTPTEPAACNAAMMYSR